MEVELAKFGRFQTGTSIQAPVYMLGYQFNGCLDYDRNGEPWVHGRGGFILLTGGECTYEEKARRVERLGAQGLIIAEDPYGEIDSRMWHNSYS